MSRHRPAFHTEIGPHLEQLRTARGWSLRRAADIARRRELMVLTRQVMFRMERGQVKNPDAEVLRALAALYAVDYTELADMVIRSNYGVRARAENAHVDDAELKRKKKSRAKTASDDPVTTDRVSSAYVDVDSSAGGSPHGRSSAAPRLPEPFAPVSNPIEAIEQFHQLAAVLSALTGYAVSIHLGSENSPGHRESPVRDQRDPRVHRGVARKKR